MIGLVILVSLFVCFFLVFYLCFHNSSLFHDLRDSSEKAKRYNIQHVNEDSFQRYAKFYGDIVPSEDNFDNKLKTIYDLINNKKVYDINVICSKSYCNLTECILKIRYLKNKRLIGDLYIDTINNKLVPCTSNELMLINKYKPYIYNNHLQINEIANVISNPKNLSITELNNNIFEELNYLDEKGLLNGLRIDDVDRTIFYYSIEKKKTHSNLITVHCPNCGALNDVNTDGKVYCSYCKNIIVGKEYVE